MTQEEILQKMIDKDTFWKKFNDIFIIKKIENIWSLTDRKSLIRKLSYKDWRFNGHNMNKPYFKINSEWSGFSFENVFFSEEELMDYINKNNLFEKKIDELMKKYINEKEIIEEKLIFIEESIKKLNVLSSKT